MFSRNLESFGNCSEERKGRWEVAKAENRGETPNISAPWDYSGNTTWHYNLVSYWLERVGVASDYHLLPHQSQDAFFI